MLVTLMQFDRKPVNITDRKNTSKRVLGGEMPLEFVSVISFQQVQESKILEQRIPGAPPLELSYLGTPPDI
jgi:hypothetical protein